MYSDAILEQRQGTLQSFLRDRLVIAWDLLDYLEDLTTKVPDTSKIQSNLSLQWRRVTQKEWILLQTAVDCLKQIPFLFEKMSLMARSFLEVLQFDLDRTKARLFGAKHLQDLMLCIADRDALEVFLGDPSYQISYREWRGNFFSDVYSLCKRIFFFFRYNPRSPRKQERIRGYRDKGSKSSDSEKARREANTSAWNEHLESILRYIQMTGCTPRQALKLLGYWRE
jgi:hypothetical protein